MPTDTQTVEGKARSSGLSVDRRMLIDGRLVAAEREQTFPSYNPATGELGVAGLEEFLERKTFAEVVDVPPAQSGEATA